MNFKLEEIAALHRGMPESVADHREFYEQPKNVRNLSTALDFAGLVWYKRFMEDETDVVSLIEATIRRVVAHSLAVGNYYLG